jgi:TolB-like protein/Tfp pilus assembly protein PilF
VDGDNQLLAEVAAAVADGFPVNWAKTESTPMSPEDRGVLAELRVLEELHRLHRRASSSPGERGGTPASPLHIVPSAGESPLLPRSESETITVDPPRTWGRFEIRELLGTGGFGVVFRAWDPHLETEVALKLLGREAYTGKSIIDEARLLARVRHPNVVSIYGADDVGGQVGLWMELLRGVTLKQAVQQRGTYSAREAAVIGLDLTRALAAVHHAGVVHRDIKPQNIMREEGGRIVLMDFGAGINLSDPHARTSLAGTLLYMAPELFEGQPATARSDLYSVGVLLFHLVTGSHPVQGATMTEIRTAHQALHRKRLRDVRPDLPGEFVRIVERATAPDPASRYASAGELEADLSGFVVAEEKQTRPRPRRFLWWAIAAGLAATLAAGIAIDRFSRPQDQTTAPVSAAGLRSLVVLPLANLSGDAAQDYFVDGMTDLLTTELSGLSSLRVIARTSAMVFKGSHTPISEIGRRLHVDGVIEGSVNRSGDRVRVTLQIVDAKTESRLWGSTYERSAQDAFTLQAEIARTMMRELRVALTDPERNRLVRAYAAKSEAQDLYLRGRYLLHTQNRDQIRQACSLFEQATQIDADYGSAWANLARCYTLLDTFGLVPSAKARTLASGAASEALSRDAGQFEAHTAMAELRFKFDWDWQDADLHYRQAIEANPNFATGRWMYARFLAAAGRVQEAVVQAREAEQSDPLSAEVKTTVGMMLFYQRRYAEADAKAAEAVALDARFPGAHIARGRALSALGRHGEAIAESKQALTLANDYGIMAELGRIYAAAGRKAEAEGILTRLTTPARPGIEFAAPQDAAYIQAALGLRDEALAGLERAVDQRSSRILWLRVDPRVDSLRQDPRFQALLTRIGGLPAVDQHASERP